MNEKDNINQNIISGETPNRKPKILDTIVGSLGSVPADESAFSAGSFGNAENMTESADGVSETREGQPPQAAVIYRRTPNRMKLLACAMIVLSVVGLVTIFTGAAGLIVDVRERVKLKEQLSAFIYPVMLTDPTGFDTGDSIPASTVISSAIWRIMLTEDTSKYSSEGGYINIPAADVERSAHALFGTGEFTHRSVGDVELFFDYTPEKNIYRVPMNPRAGSYVPVIRELTDTGGVYSLTVDYMIPSPGLPGINVESTPVKTLSYMVRHNGRRPADLQISAIIFNPSQNGDI